MVQPSKGIAALPTPLPPGIHSHGPRLSVRAGNVVDRDRDHPVGRRLPPARGIDHRAAIIFAVTVAAAAAYLTLHRFYSSADLVDVSFVPIINDDGVHPDEYWIPGYTRGDGVVVPGHWERRRR
jgi:hypothetical protein